MTKQIALLAILIIPSGTWAGSDLDDFLGYYLERTDSVTAGAGNAKEANAAIQIADPWPAYAKNRHIPVSGERLSRTIRRYQDVTKLKEAPQTLTPEGLGGSTASPPR